MDIVCKKGCTAAHNTTSASSKTTKNYLFYSAIPLPHPQFSTLTLGRFYIRIPLYTAISVWVGYTHGHTQRCKLLQSISQRTYHRVMLLLSIDPSICLLLFDRTNDRPSNCVVRTMPMHIVCCINGRRGARWGRAVDAKPCRMQINVMPLHTKYYLLPLLVHSLHSQCIVHIVDHCILYCVSIYSCCCWCCC